MTFLLPLVALALAFAAPLLLRQERGKIEPLRIGALLLLLAIAAFVVSKHAPEVDRTPALIGLVLGALAAAVGSWAGGLAIGVAAASALHLLAPASLPASGLALIAGAGLGALTVGGEIAALAAVLVVAGDNLGMHRSEVPAISFIGSQVGLAVAVGALIAEFVPKSIALLKPVVVGLVSLLGAFLVAWPLQEKPLVYCIGLGALAGIVVHLLMPGQEGESPRVGLGAVIGIGLATVAFGLGKGMGMSLAALAAVGALLAVGNLRAVLALGPLVGLVLYRVLREEGTGATRALDIGQHYTLLAIVLGMSLPLLPTDWLKARKEMPAAIGGALWGIVALAAAPLVVVALGMRGGIGFVVGLGTTGLVQAMRTERDLKPLALGAGLAGTTILALSWLGDESVLTRDQKLRLFEYAGVGIAVVALLLALVGRKTEEAS